MTLFDAKEGQATRAGSAGIISPLAFEKGRNQQWYQLAKDGAAFFPKLIQDSITLMIPSINNPDTDFSRQKKLWKILLTCRTTKRKDAPESVRFLLR